jgi:NADH:ubiquinone oxidoreductase subunit
MTLVTDFITWWSGERVGQDEFGNIYYRNRKRKAGQAERRWVVYNGEAEASKVPAEWHGWLHKTVEHPPQHIHKWPWQKPHQANMTGTIKAYRPKGHVLQGGKRAKATGDYEPWQPK